MKSLKLLFAAALSIVPVHMVYSQTASILPPAKTTFLDKNGKPLASGTIDFYIPGTTTRKMTWQDSGQTIPNTNPVVLDNAGRGLILGDGSYRQVVRDKYGNLIWDQITSSTGSGGGGGGTPTVGDGDPVGIIKAWSGFAAPAQYAFAYGQEFVRASYPELFQAITYQSNVNCTSGSPTLSGISDTSQLSIGSPIESSCLNAGSTIISKTISTIVASSSAIISTSTTARFFPYGNGNGSSTFNLPDLRGRTIAGRDNMGGIDANRLTLFSGLGSKGGSQNYSILRTDLPNISPTFTGTAATITSTSLTNKVVTANSFATVNVGPGSGGDVLTGTGISTVSSTASYTPAGQIQSLNGGVAQTSMSLVQPTQIYNYIIKILPDSNPNTFFGVASIGGMYGIIECGFGITCSGNTISAVNSILPPPTPTNLGGLFQSNAPANQFAIGIDLAGNLLYGGGSTTVNGQVCTIGGSCTITATAGAITVGTTLISGGSNNGFIYKDNSGLVASTATSTNSILTTNGSGVPTLLSSLPTINLPAFTGDVTSSIGSNNLIIPTNSLSNSKLSQSNSATLKGNPTGSVANIQDFTIQGLSTATLDSLNDYIPVYNSATGQILKTTPNAIAAGGALPSISNKQILANTSGVSSQPIGTSATTWFDSAFCNTVGYIVARTTGSWVCSQSIAINITWLGVKCDGVTDDTSAINAAIVAVPAGSTLVFPSTACLVSTGNSTGNPYSIIVGKSIHISFPNGGGINQTFFGALFNIQSSNVTIDGAAGATLNGPSTSTIYVGYSNAIVSNNYGATTNNYTNIHISGLRITNFGQGGIFLWYCYYCSITNNTIIEVRYAGIDCITCAYSQITNNRVLNVWSSTASDVPPNPINRSTHYGIAVSTAGVGSTSFSVIVANNVVSNVPAWECYDTHDGQNISFVNNIGTGCLIGLNAGSVNNAISGIIISNNQFTCIDLNQPVYQGQSPGTSIGDGGIKINGLSSANLGSKIIVKGNTITNCGSSSVSPGGNVGAIETQWVGPILIEGNIIQNPRYRGMSIFDLTLGSILNNTIFNLTAGPLASGAYLFDLQGNNLSLDLGNNTAYGGTYDGYNILAQNSGFGVGISRTNLFNGVSNLYVGGSIANRIDLGATAP